MQPVAVSVAVTVKLKVPLELVVPDNTPVVDKVIPVGNVPVVTANVYEPVPPLAVIVWL